jgi:hypothetical protein
MGFRFHRPVPERWANTPTRTDQAAEELSQMARPAGSLRGWPRAFSAKTVGTLVIDGATGAAPEAQVPEIDVSCSS